MLDHATVRDGDGLPGGHVGAACFGLSLEHPVNAPAATTKTAAVLAVRRIITILSTRLARRRTTPGSAQCTAGRAPTPTATVPRRADTTMPRRANRAGHRSRVAEDMGFEPMRGFIPNTISNRAH